MRSLNLWLWLTDTHLNNLAIWSKYKFFTDIKEEKPKGIILTGDITNGIWLSFDLSWFAKLGIPIFYIEGNHDRFWSSIENTKTKIQKIIAKYPHFTWLEEEEEPIKLDEEVCLIGAAGWFDGMYGDPKWLNWKSDWWLIKEFRQMNSFEARLEYSRQLAKDSADKIERRLVKALEQGYNTIYIATHMPPFLEATRDKGTVMEQFWLPYNTNDILGKTIEKVMEGRKKKRAIILAGHSHFPTYIRYNRVIECQVGAGNYIGMPQSQRIYL